MGRPTVLLASACAWLLAAGVGWSLACGRTPAAQDDPGGDPTPPPGDGEVLARQELEIPDPAAGDIYGAALDVDGDLLVVASEYDDDGGEDAGAAYVFRRDTGGAWRVEQKLVADDARPGDNFGRSVAISGDVVVVGAHWDDHGPARDAGSAYVFRHRAGTWVQEAKLQAPGARRDDRFGVSVDVHGDLIGVSAWRADTARGVDAGAAFAFRHAGGRWSLEQKLVAPDGRAGDQFGRSIAVGDGLLVVGAWRADDGGKDAGAAYVYRRAAGRWAVEQKLVPEVSPGAGAGWAVALSAERLLVGAYLDDAAGKASGSVSVWARDDGEWAQEARLQPDDAAARDWFGYALALDGPRAVIGAHSKVTAVGRSGAAYAFRRGPKGWRQEARLVAPDTAAGDMFGFFVSVSGTDALVGAWRTDEEGEDTGSAYAFGLPAPR